MNLDVNHTLRPRVPQSIKCADDHTNNRQGDLNECQDPDSLPPPPSSLRQVLYAYDPYGRVLDRGVSRHDM